LRHRRLVEALLTVKLWRTLLFAILAAGLGAYIFLVEKPRMQAESQEDRLVDLRVDDVDRLTLTYPDKPPITVARDGKRWRMTAPLATPADDAQVERLLEQIAKTKAVRRIPASKAEDLANYGLEGNGTHVRISIDLHDGTKMPDIIVGRTTPVGFQAFARLEGHDDVVVTPLIFHTGVKKTVFDLRDKHLFSFDAPDVTTVDLVKPDETIKIVKEDGHWHMTSPREDRADDAQVDALIASVHDIDALQFFDEATQTDRTKYGLEKPQLTARLECAKSEPVGFHLGSRTDGAPPGYYLSRLSDGLIAKVAESVQVRVDKSATDLRDKHLFTCAAADIARVEFQRADGANFAMALSEDGTWTVDPNEGRSVKQSIAGHTRENLATLAAHEIVADDVTGAASLAHYGLDSPDVQVAVQKKDGSSCGIAYGAVVNPGSDDARYYVKRADDGTIMSLPAYLYSRINVVPDDLLVAKAAPRKETDQKSDARGAAASD
jgi:hypothetical protein